MRVKQFWSSSWSPGALDFKINRWLKGNRVDIIDIKLAAYPVTNDNDTEITEIALVMYKDWPDPEQPKF